MRAEKENKIMELSREQAIYFMAVEALNLHSSSLDGMSQENIKLFQDINNAQPGDLVLEMTSSFRFLRAYKELGLENAFQILSNQLGILKSVERDPETRELVHYLDALSGMEIRWTNCKFIKLIGCEVKQ